MKKQVTIDQFRKVLTEEIAQRQPEQVKVSYCCPIFLGGYTRDGSDMFSTDIEEIIAGVSKHVSEITTIVKIDSAYLDRDELPRYTLFIDILV
jgi:hypothetical protein